MTKDRIFLIGFMGVGKTTIAELYASKNDCVWIDTDTYIQSQQGCSVQEIFAGYGEAYFRKLETEAILEAVKTQEDKSKKQCIVSCGGGIVLKQENVCFMKEQGAIVYLRAGIQTLVSRLQSAEGRPVLQEGKKTLEERVAELMQLRAVFYENAADVIVDTDDLTPEEVVEQLMRK